MHEQVDHALGTRLEMGRAQCKRIACRTAGDTGPCQRPIVVEHPTGGERAETAARAKQKFPTRLGRTFAAGVSALLRHAKCSETIVKRGPPVIPSQPYATTMQPISRPAKNPARMCQASLRNDLPHDLARNIGEAKIPAGIAEG